ncbi:MAG TPA: SpoIIE family protein phosphatase [Tissierellia bacterium]|jgi:hypothetical protein|nr:SpoIIE family protein phosphatase [Tissierellia bacterium]
MNYYVDIAYNSMNKYGEELCGDKVEIIRNNDRNIIVMADGLGSGVKANILSTLTSKIAATMLKNGASIVETVDTIIHTLPVCKVRELAYSTFTIVEICEDGSVYAAEFDNPPIFLVRNSELINIDKNEITIGNALVKESKFKLQKGDLLTIVSDGIVHAGIGGVLNQGWGWSSIGKYLNRLSQYEKSARNIVNDVLDTCQYLYIDKPGDDATVVAVKIREPEVINMFTGPPEDETKDKMVVECLMNEKGKKVVCGGTAAKIVARELKKEIKTSMDFIDPDVPPIASIEGIDLVTEGVLTISKTIERLNMYLESPYRDNPFYRLYKEDGASKLAKLFIEDCTHLNLWIGKAVNPAHQNPDFPINLSIKLKVVNDLVKVLEKLDIKVNINYV